MFVHCCRFFKDELSRVPEKGEVRTNILTAIRNAEKSILSTLIEQREEMQRQNSNMEKAIKMLTKKRNEQ